MAKEIKLLSLKESSYSQGLIVLVHKYLKVKLRHVSVLVKNLPLEYPKKIYAY